MERFEPKNQQEKSESGEQIKEFKNETENIFNLNNLEKGRLPLDVGEFEFESFTDKRVNHYCIKSSDSEEYVFGEIDSEEFRRFIGLIEAYVSKIGLDVKNRYCFVTIDQGLVELDHTLRDPDWHLDGMQGDEVLKKRPTDLQFIWSDSLPTTFTSQKFDVRGFDPSVHNIFKWIGKQIDPEQVIETQPFHIYAMNAYHAHKATEAKETIYRRFVRVSYTFVPITSKRMIVNPDMKYNYKIQQTTGEIPSYLQ